MKTKCPDTHDRPHLGSRKRTLPITRAMAKLTIITCVALASFYCATEIMSRGLEASQITKGEKTMFLTRTNSPSRPDMQPVAGTATPKIESATFALG